MMPDSAPKLGDHAAIQRELHGLLSLKRRRSKADYRRVAHLTIAAMETREHGNVTDADIAELTALVSEYESLRQESMATTTNRIQIMMLGLAGMLGLAAGAIAALEKQRNALIIIAAYCYAVPLVYAFVLIVWLSEAVRAHRVGYFLAGSVEGRINALLNRFTLSWETALWTGLMPRDELLGPSMMAMGVLGLIAAGCPVVGCYIAGWRLVIPGSPIWNIIMPYAGFMALAVYVAKYRGRLINVPTIRSFEHADENN